jgi:hypothetical protein
MEACAYQEQKKYLARQRLKLFGLFEKNLPNLLCFQASRIHHLCSFIILE